MRRNFSHAAVRLLLWVGIFGALTILFRSFMTTPAEAAYDSRTVLTVLMDGDPVQMTMAEYLPRAVAAEMPVSFGAEALKAQAVAARSYVLAAHRHDDADVCTDSGCCLAYKTDDELRAFWGDDYDVNMAAVTAAVAATDGQILTYGGSVIQAVFHASSAGSTEDSAAVWSAQPYLVTVSSPETEETVPDLVSTAVFPPAALAARLGLAADTDPDTWLEGAEEDDAGRVRTLRLAGQTFSGSYVRSALGLTSTDFLVRYDGDENVFVFTAAGKGHGVGMSQVGAKLLAADGWTFDAILTHYYPGTELSQGQPGLLVKMPAL